MFVVAVRYGVMYSPIALRRKKTFICIILNWSRIKIQPGELSENYYRHHPGLVTRGLLPMFRLSVSS